MLSNIITKVNTRILSLLIGKEASLSDIARQTKTTKANTFKALKFLENNDIVRKNIYGRSHVYRFNFLHPNSEHIINLISKEKNERYNKKLKNLPLLVHCFLENALNGNYRGCIFFGSSIISDKYKDIDIFIILKNKDKIREIEKKLRIINKNLSAIFGTLEELEQGLKNQDMLYKNIIDGIVFGVNVIKIKHMVLFLRKKDIRERFILAYREILSCLEFKEKEYQEAHLEKGVIDLIYTILNYLDSSPKNDNDALSLFKQQLNKNKPKTIKEAIGLIEEYAWIL